MTLGLKVNQELIAVFQSFSTRLSKKFFTFFLCVVCLGKAFHVSLLLFFSVCKNVYACINVKFISLKLLLLGDDNAKQRLNVALCYVCSDNIVN